MAALYRHVMDSTSGYPLNYWGDSTDDWNIPGCALSTFEVVEIHEELLRVLKSKSEPTVIRPQFSYRYHLKYLSKVLEPNVAPSYERRFKRHNRREAIQP